MPSSESVKEKIKIGRIGSETGTSDTRPCKPESKAAAANKAREKVKRRTDKRTLRVYEKNRSNDARFR